MSEPFQLKLLRLQADLWLRLKDVHDTRKVLVYGLRAAKELFAAPEAAAATLKPGREQADMVFTIPRSAEWDVELLTRYIRGARPTIPGHTLLAPIKRRRRCWTVLGLRYADRSFTPDEREALFALTQTLTEIIRQLDEKRSRTVRRKIERKIADHQEPKDLIYDLLHGLRSLTRYDHSASLFIAQEGSEALELIAEQIAWTKARSRRIGRRLELDEAARAELGSGKVRLYERDGVPPEADKRNNNAPEGSKRKEGWRDPHGGATSLPDLLDLEASPETPAEVSMLCAPIVTPEGALGVLKISARRHGVLGGHEAGLVEEFLPLASLAVQFSVRTETLQERVLQSERKHALANLTRGIAHDVNNALGAMLPLVQQMRDDAENREIEAATLAADLASIETSLQTCRRIFGGMLAIARGGSDAGVGHGNLRRAIDAALSVLGDSMKRRAIEVTVALPRELPAIRGSQGDLTQLFLNLCANARDAMPDGGELWITATNGLGVVQVIVEDTGTGIPARMLERVSEPFFTTKAEGNGLGLSICRSILWDVGGEMNIETTPGEGTRARLLLPVLDGADRDPSEGAGGPAEHTREEEQA